LSDRIEISIEFHKIGPLYLILNCFILVFTDYNETGRGIRKILQNGDRWYQRFWSSRDDIHFQNIRTNDLSSAGQGSITKEAHVCSNIT